MWRAQAVRSWQHGIAELEQNEIAAFGTENEVKERKYGIISFSEKRDGAGSITLKSGAEFALATMKGKYDRDAVIMYTDRNRLTTG